MWQSSPEPKDVCGVRKGARATSDRRKIGDGNARKDRSRYNRAGGYEGVYEAKDGGYNSSRSRGGKTRIRYQSMTTTRRILRFVFYLARRVKARIALFNHSRTNFELKFPRQMIYNGQGTITLSQ